MKRISTCLAVLVLGAGLGSSLLGCDAGGKPRIGVTLISVDDSYASIVRRAIEARAQGKAQLSVLDGQNQRTVQNAQIEAMIADKAKAIIVNPVDPSTIDALIFRAKAAGVPIVFFSRDPSAVAITFWDKAFLVGVKSQEAEDLQTEILADYWKRHPEADKNKDGKVQVVLIRGDASKLSSQASTDNLNAAFTAAGMGFDKLAEANAGWTRAGALAKMTDLIKAYGLKRIEAVICANDEMALGAIEALRVAGLFKSGSETMPVIGTDGTRFALDAIADGSLLGTVRSDADSQGRAAFDLAYALATDGNPQATGLNLVDGKSVYIRYQKVTKDNYQSFGD
jgi:methyl-galactoside transport system substrate-binding protein